MQINLTKNTLDYPSIWIGKSLTIIIDNDLKMDIQLEMRLFEKNNTFDGEYVVDYDITEYLNIIFKGIEISGKDFKEWVKKYDVIMLCDLEFEIENYVKGYIKQYEDNPKLLINEFLNRWNLK
jgi:hypothetical protein